MVETPISAKGVIRLTVSGVSAQSNPLAATQSKTVSGNQQVQSKKPDGDGDHGVEPQGGKTGKLLNVLA